jgi:hypothetical protein
MSRLDDEIHPEVHVFVEDREAGVWLREILASSAQTAELLPRIRISPVGPSNVVSLLGNLGANEKLPYPSVAIVDGDHPYENCITLPGGLAPEKQVFGDLKCQNWPNVTERFGIGAGTLLTALDDALLEPDHHNWTRKVGDQVLKSSASVWEILASEWCKSCLTDEDRDRIAAGITAAIQP